MKKTWYAILAVVLLVLSTGFIATVGDTYTVSLDISRIDSGFRDYVVTLEKGDEILNIEDVQILDGVLRVKLRSVSRGKDYLSVTGPEDVLYYDGYYVHRFGIITKNTFLGDMTGGTVIPLSIAVYLSAILCSVILRYRRNMKTTIFRYSNIRDLSWIIYLVPLLITQIFFLMSRSGILQAVRGTMSAASVLSFFAMPAAFVVFVFVTISNIQLMRREGRNWRNMLGCILGILVCFGTLFPHLLGEYLQHSTIIDVHNEKGLANHIDIFVENSILTVVTYLEAVLLGTIILSVKAARSVPSFDRDCIVILGSQIKEDGTLTNLLKGRVDRALEFARMQKEASGRDLIFVPSGGRGPDEVISEAEAMKNYLAGSGIPEDMILVEDRSVNTYENMRNSAALIRERLPGSDPRIAFSTTNYHVFRAGILAEQQGIHAEGIGSATKSYFWINAFIREFIATLYSERKWHLLITGIMVLSVLAMTCLIYLSNVL